MGLPPNWLLVLSRSTRGRDRRLPPRNPVIGNLVPQALLPEDAEQIQWLLHGPFREQWQEKLGQGVEGRSHVDVESGLVLLGYAEPGYLRRGRPCAVARVRAVGNEGLSEGR